MFLIFENSFVFGWNVRITFLLKAFLTKISCSILEIIWLSRILPCFGIYLFVFDDK